MTNRPDDRFEGALRPAIDKGYELLGQLSDRLSRGEIATGREGDLMRALAVVEELRATCDEMATAIHETDEAFRRSFDSAARALAPRSEE